MKRLRLLIVCYYFPPAAGGGVQRVLKWCKYLPDSDVEVHVLCPDDPGWLDTDPDLGVPEGTVVHRVKNRSSASLRPAEELARSSGLRRLWTRIRLLPRRFMVPDIHVRWARDAAREGVRLSKQYQFDAVLSSSPPESAHLAAGRIAHAIEVPHIVDLRDSWLSLPHLRLDHRAVRLKHWLNTRIAARIIPRATLVTAVSDPIADEQRDRYPTLPHKAIATIPNGVDFADLEHLPELRRRAEDVGKFLILYTGNFFGVQSPASLLDALEQVAKQAPHLVDDIRMRFIGTLRSADLGRIADSSVLTQMVRLDSFAPYATVLAHQREADLLYMYIAGGPRNRAVYTGKLFEYLASTSPILAAVPHDGVAADLLRRSAGQAGFGPGASIWLADPDDAEAIADAITAAVGRWRTSGTPTRILPDSIRTEISRDGQAETLARLIRAAIDRQA